MRRRARCVSALLLFVAAQAHASTPAIPVPDDEALAKGRQEAYWAVIRQGSPDQEILDVLHRGDFTALEQKIETVQHDYEAGKLDEHFVFAAVNPFLRVDLQTEIERWATEHPHAWPALAARGMMHLGAAQRARGTAYIDKTSQEQLRQMEASVKLAAQDFAAVLKQRPRFLPAYARLIDIAGMAGSDSLGHAAITEALRQDPNTFAVREHYLQKLEPRWGGSYDEMDAFAREAQAHASVNPRLKDLLGSSWAERGYDRILVKDWEHAVEMYSQALRFGRDPLWLIKRAKAYKEMRKYPEAIADLNEALHYNPDMAGALADRATCLLFSGQRAAALPDYERATELAPDWSWVARAYSKELYISLRPQDAAAVLERFLAAHPRDPDALEDLGLIYRQTLHQPDHARELMERLIEIEPKRAAAWRIYGDALFDLHDPRTRATYEHYFELVDPKDPIESKIAPFYQRKLPYAPPAEIAH